MWTKCQKSYKFGICPALQESSVFLFISDSEMSHAVHHCPIFLIEDFRRGKNVFIPAGLSIVEELNIEFEGSMIQGKCEIASLLEVKNISA